MNNHERHPRRARSAVLPTADVIRRIRKLHALFLAGAIEGPEQHEVHPDLPRGSRENYLYFTLPCCVNFQRSSPAMWQSALRTFNDPDTAYLFSPENVCARDRGRVAKDLIKHRLALQTNRHPEIWMRICRTLCDHYDGDPRKILEEGQHDVDVIIRTLQVDKKDRFPYLGGIKLSNYWLFIVTSFTDAHLSNTGNISIIPDTHIVKSTVRLGLADEGVHPKEVERIWRAILKTTGIVPGEMHSALWRWSRGGFAAAL
ncbi:MAG: hypothetical protein HYX68_27095 [Planctomycetes bacterium]|nr:hypothetical protein [Planctomycetota bacterium]